MSDNNINFSDLDYGIYSCEEFISENMKYDVADMTKLYVRAVRLPEGKSNIIYVLSDTFEHTIELFMPKNRNFIMTPVYKRMFYPQILIDGFMKKRFRINLMQAKEARFKMIVSDTKLRTVPTRSITNDPFENYIYCLCDIYEATKPLTQQFPLMRLMKEYFSEFIRIIKTNSPETNPKDEKTSSNNRILLIDAKNFAFNKNAPIEENKTNPLFLFYLAFLRLKDMTLLNVDMDMMICARNMFFKFNPAKLSFQDISKFKIALFRIMDANLDKYVDKENQNDQHMIDKPIENAKSVQNVNDVVKTFTLGVSDEVKDTIMDHITNKLTDQNIDPEHITKAIFKKIEKPKTTHSFITGELGIEDEEESDEESNENEEEYKVTEINEDEPKEEREKNKSLEEIINNKELAAKVDDVIQDRIAPMKNFKTAQVSSARDLKLREAQKKVRVQNSTIGEILARDSANVQIETDDHSRALKTSNQNLKKITFENFNKTYLDKVYTKDIVSMFDQLKDKSSPFMITKIDVEDSSNVMDYKETWTIDLIDEVNTKHTIKVDFPKFIDNKFMIIGGNKKNILNQNLFNPLIKDTADTVIMTTNYNKVTIERHATKSLQFIERIFSLIKKAKSAEDLFVAGDLTRMNKEYICSLEYDEYAKRLFSFKTDGCEIYFSRPYIKEKYKNSVTGLKDTEYLIGYEKDKPIIIDENTGFDRTGRTITDIIKQNLPDDLKQVYSQTKAPVGAMYVKCTLAGQTLPVAAVLISWIGISKLLKEMKINYTFHKDRRSIPRTNNKDTITFMDGVLEYDNPLFVQLIMNGFHKLNPAEFKFEEFDSSTAVNEYIKSVWGSYQGVTEIQVFYEFLLDPITKEVCQNLNLPDYIEALMIHAVKMLADEHYENKSSDKLYRTRCLEVIPAILHRCIANQYKAYIKSGRKLPMSLKQDILIKELMELKTCEDYSTLNPAAEVGKMSIITCRGYMGTNLEDAFTQDKRALDASSIGRIAMSTDPCGTVGINRQLTVEPTITNIRGQREIVEDVDTLKDVNVMSPFEMLTAGIYRIDDAFRTSMANKQTGHIVPIKDAAPAIVSNGYDEAIQFHLSDDFVINAEDDGEVVEVNDDLNFIIVKYKNGKTKAVNTAEAMVKNGGGGFYLSNKLKPVYTKVGQRFKKDDPLAYHPLYFKYSPLTGLRYCAGTLLKVGFMQTYNSHEDGGLCTMKVAERMKANVVYQEAMPFKKNSNIVSMVKIGDHVNLGDPLIRYNSSFDDAEIVKYLNKLSIDNKLAFEDELKTELKASHAGRVIDIKVYSLYKPEELSESLGNIVKSYFEKNNNRKKLLDKYDKTPGTYKCGYLFRDSTQEFKNKYNQINNKYKDSDVLIEIYIEHDLLLGVGDKVAMYSANKNVISEIIPPGFEPYSEFRPDEEVSMITAPGAINRRMTTSVLPIAAIGKVLIEMKRKIKEMAKFSGNAEIKKDEKETEKKT